MIEQKQSLQQRLLTGYCPDERERLEYTLYRIGDEVHPGEVIQAQYVCRNASQDEMGEILNSPKLIEATHQQMLQDSFSDRLDLNCHQPVISRRAVDRTAIKWWRQPPHQRIFLFGYAIISSSLRRVGERSHDLIVSRNFTILLERRAPGRVSVGLSEFGVPIKARPPSDIVRRQDSLYWYAVCEEGAG